MKIDAKAAYSKIMDSHRKYVRGIYDRFMAEAGRRRRERVEQMKQEKAAADESAIDAARKAIEDETTNQSL